MDITAVYNIGQNWINATNGVLENNWKSVCWASKLGLFCAVAESGTTNSRVMISSDGKTWKNATTGVIDTTSWDSVCWSPELGLFCAVGNSTTTKMNSVMISTNGTTWTNATSNSDGAVPYTEVCWAAELGLFCAVSLYGTIITSTNGNVWNQTASTGGRFTSVCWSPELGRFCAVGNNFNSTINCTYISTNGTNWRQANNAILGTWTSICWSPELNIFCAVSSNSLCVKISKDGLNWISYTSDVISSGIFRGSVCWSAELGLFCAVAYSGTTNQRVMISKNGITWNNSISGVVSSNWQSVCWSPELSSFCAVASSGTTNKRVMITNPSYQLPTTTNKYYIPLVSSNGKQEIKTKSNVSYNINNNTLNLVNLSTTNPPSCSAAPVNSNDLINIAYLNSFVGDYTQGWIYDDWITGDVSGSLNWNIDKPANASIIASDVSGHIGILRLNAISNGIILYFNIGNVFNYSNIKSVKFIVNPFSDAYNESGITFIGLSDGYNAIDNDSVGFYKNQGSGWVYVMNRAIINTNVYYTLPVNIQKKWILFEIEITNNIPIFYITIENGSRQVACAPGTTITTTTLVSPVIRQTLNSIDIDYIDIKYNNMYRK